MPNVVEIVLELRYRIFFTVAIGIVDLGPTGDARFHQMAKMIEWNLLLVALDALDPFRARSRSEEHTSELQSQFHLVCRLLLEKKKKKKKKNKKINTKKKKIEKST